MTVIKKKYLIPLPIKYNEYLKGQQFTVGKMSQTELKGTDAQIILEEDSEINSESLKNAEHSEIYEIYKDCVYTRKLLKFGNKVPSVLTAFFPSKMFNAYEKSYQSFPKCTTLYESCYLDKTNHKISIISDHLENLSELKAEKYLKRIKQQTTSLKTNKKNVSKEDFDILNIMEETGDKKLDEEVKLDFDWIETALEKGEDYVLLEKDIYVEINKFGIGFVAGHIESEMRNIILKANKNIVRYKKEWEKLSHQEIKDLNKKAFLLKKE